MGHIREHTDADAEALLRILNEGQRNPMSLEVFLDEESRRDPEHFHYRAVFEDQGEIVGGADLGRARLGPKGWLWGAIKVLSERRGHGIGSQLWRDLEKKIGEVDPPGVMGQVNDDDPLSRRWAENLGFFEWAHRFENLLDLSEVSMDLLGDAVEVSKRSGVEFKTMVEFDDEAGYKRLHELFSARILDAPDAVDSEPPSWSFFQRSFIDSPLVVSEGIFLAVIGGEWVGLTITQNRGPEIYTWFTGVDPAHRGKGIALALKKLSIDYAKSKGAERMGTHNLSINEPILALNRKLGYKQQPGLWLMRLKLKD